MNREELPRIRLKVATNAGINILCTAVRTWKVVDWLPHIEEAYREVKQDQEGDEDSKRRFIKAIRIKKGNFYIANSEFIGDIFQDNDEVQCQIAFPQGSEKKKSKKEKKVQKKNRKEESLDEEGQFQKIEEKNRVAEMGEWPVESNTKEKSKKKIKPQNQQIIKPQAESKKNGKKDKNIVNAKPITTSNDKKQHEKASQNKSKQAARQNLMKSIDFSKLKSILQTKDSSNRNSKVDYQVKQEEKQPNQQLSSQSSDSS